MPTSTYDCVMCENTRLRMTSEGEVVPCWFCTEPMEEAPPDPNDCGCSMCCGTHVVVNCAGHQRPCDYCPCQD